MNYPEPDISDYCKALFSDNFLNFLIIKVLILPAQFISLLKDIAKFIPIP